AATASFHLAKLLDGNMIVVARQGRHRYYRLAGHEVAAALEAIGLISPALPVRTLRQSREAVALAEARTCYDHLAGRAGVGLLDALLGQGLLAREKSKSLVRTDRGDSASTRFVVTGAGARTLASFGINVTEVRRSRRRFAGECIDWTQRRGHLNGALAAAITSRLFEVGWITRGARRRSVLITAAGAQGLSDTFGLDLGLRAWPGHGKVPIMRGVIVDGKALVIEDVVAVARGQARAILDPGVAERMEVSRSVVVQALSGGAPVYGVNTGFGALVDTPIGEADLTTLQGAIVRSHAAATGVPLDDQAVRAILLLRARTLAAGYSGVRVELPARLLELLALDLLPVI